MIYCGIDSGKKGCFCVLNTESKCVYFMKTPFIDDITIDFSSIEMIPHLIQAELWLEKVAGGDNNRLWSSSNSFNFGCIYGQILGYFSDRKINLVHARTWQSNYYKYRKDKSAKEQSFETFKLYHPDQKVTKTGSSGFIDAYLIARYAAESDLPFFGNNDYTFIEILAK